MLLWRVTIIEVCSYRGMQLSRYAVMEVCSYGGMHLARVASVALVPRYPVARSRCGTVPSLAYFSGDVPVRGRFAEFCIEHTRTNHLLKFS